MLFFQCLTVIQLPMPLENAYLLLVSILVCWKPIEGFAELLGLIALWSLVRLWLKFWVWPYLAQVLYSTQVRYNTLSCLVFLRPNQKCCPQNCYSNTKVHRMILLHSGIDCWRRSWEAEWAAQESISLFSFRVVTCNFWRFALGWRAALALLSCFLRCEETMAFIIANTHTWHDFVS